MNKLKKIVIWILREQIPAICSKNDILTSLYYLAFNKSFKREHRAVLAGKVKHIKEAKNYYLLVRNTHRIEKGLLMRPRRNLFAKAFIGETIDSFETVWSHDAMNKNLQMKWFYDVLNDYFAVCGNNKEISKYHKRFKYKTADKELSKNLVYKNKKSANTLSVPYLRKEESRSDISYEEFYKLTYQRRSVRWFLDKLVPREIIDKAILAAIQSPSACNRQPFEFRVFDKPELVKQIVELPMGTKGYGHNIPVFIVLVGNLDAYFNERDRHIIYIDASLAAMPFMLALETMGLSSCAINWPDIEVREKRMEKLLKLKKYQRPIMCMGVGYPDYEGMVAYSEKRPLNQIRTFNK